LPPYTFHYEGPDTFACFNLDGFKELLKLDLDVESLRVQVKILNNVIENDKIKINKLQENLDLQIKTIDELETENDRLYRLWSDENKRRRIIENKTNWPAIIGWSSAGVLLVSTAVIAGYAASSK